MTRLRARLTLGGLIAVLAWALWPSSTLPDRQPPPAGSGDAALFMSIAERLAAGDSYYEAFGDELRRNGYPAASTFNWRTPLHLSLVAWLSVPLSGLLLKLLVILALLATAAALSRSGPIATGIGTGLQMGAVATAFQPQAVGISDILAGVLVALSVCSYYRQYWVAGATLGVAAVFMRELVAPYGVVCGLLAISGRRRNEAAIWIVAGLGYAACYALHAMQVQAHQLPGDLAHLQPWQQWNGLRFTLATIGVNGWLQFVPGWAAAVVLALGLAGTLARGMVAQVRVALLAYLGLFAVVGLPFNSYWGFVTAPLWAFGVAHAVEGLRRVVTAAKRPAST